MVCLFRFVALCCFFSLSFPFYQFQLRNFVLLVRSFARPFVCTCFVRNTLFLPLIIELKEPSNRFVVYIFLSMYVYKSLEDKCVSQPFILSLKLLKSSGPRSASYVCAFIYMIFVASIYVRVRLCVHLRF